jgi:hypothetical protein
MTTDPMPDRVRKRLIGGAVALVVVLVLVGTVVIVSAHARKPAGPPTAARVATATVIRTNLSNSQSLPGTLGYGAPSTVIGKGLGTITSLPTGGTTISRGQSLYGVDDQPEILFYGATPLFRTLASPDNTTATPPTANSGSGSGTSGGSVAGAGDTGSNAPPASPPVDNTPLQGADVTVVADNLMALGYRIGEQPSSAATEGDVYTTALADAVAKWQKAVGMQPTGTLGPNQIVVYPGAVRVNGLTGQLGDAATRAVMSVTPTDKVITVPVAATDMGGITAGATVSITLPDGRQTPGTVASISQNIQPTNQQDPNGASTPPTVNVTISADNSGDVSQLAAAPVQVTFTTSGKNNVLAVPVTALLALSGGGYALEKPNGTLIGVQTGLFANGEVEVSGPGVAEGLLVQTATS